MMFQLAALIQFAIWSHFNNNIIVYVLHSKNDVCAEKQSQSHMLTNDSNRSLSPLKWVS